jgi:[acyl-carrier-protein] S-malonyltransferase
MKTALVFPGQGSQTVGMGKALAEAFPMAREVFARVDAALGQKLSHLIFEGPEAELTLTANAQPALMATSLAALAALESEAGLVVARDATFVAGHSLGEYSALCAAGALTIEEAARLLRIRGEAMQRAVPVGDGAMAAILGLDFAEVSSIAQQAASELYLTGSICEAANDNGGGQVVISGTRAAVERAMALAKLKGAKRALPLPVSAPFHCALMKPAAETMAEALREARLQAARPPVVANFSASALSDPDSIRKSLIAQITGTVRWRESVVFMVGRGVERFVEIGAGKVLAGLIKRIATGASTLGISAPADVAAYKITTSG